MENGKNDIELLSRQDAIKLGLKRYFTGNPCAHGHVAQRFVSSLNCVICATNNRDRYRSQNPNHDKEYTQKWREQNPEKLQAQKDTRRKRYFDNIEESRRKNKEYDLKRKAKRKIQRAKFYEENKEKMRERSRKYREANLEKCREANRQYALKKPHKFRDSANRRRARLAKAEGNYSNEDIQKIFIQQKGKCIICLVKFTKEKKYTIDHIMPLHLGGSNDVSNLQLVCKGCNSRKGHRHPMDFVRAEGRLI